MAKLILRCNYFKNESARHRANYVKYLGTREGVEFDSDQLPRAFWEDADMHGKKENFIDYVAGRPGVIKVPGQRHGLFSEKGTKVDLDEVMKEVAEHEGTVWINVISLKREDAERLCFDKLESWQGLIRSHIGDLSEAFHVSGRDLRWYAAFHNEGHHPHVHLLVYSEGKEGYLDRKGIQNLKSKLTRDMFRDELTTLYDEKTRQRKSVKERAGEELLKAMEGLSQGNFESLMIEAKMRVLGQRLLGIKGKKVYGYLHKDVKAMVDDVFRDLEKIPEVKECYDKWLEWQAKIIGYYRDGDMPKVPMSGNPEFKSVKNVIIREALRLASENEVKASAKGHGRKEAGTNGNGERAVQTMNQAANGSNAFSARRVTDETFRLMKYLEKIFQGKMEKSKLGRKMVSESKGVQREMERRAALGQKDGGAEDITQTM